MGVSIASLSGTNDKSAMTETDALVVADWLVIVTYSLEAVAQRCHHLVAVVAHLGGSYDAVVVGVGVTVVAHEGVEVAIGMAVLVSQVEVDVLAGLESQTQSEAVGGFPVGVVGRGSVARTGRLERTVAEAVLVEDGRNPV